MALCCNWLINYVNQFNENDFEISLFTIVFQGFRYLVMIFIANLTLHLHRIRNFVMKTQNRVKVSNLDTVIPKLNFKTTSNNIKQKFNYEKTTRPISAIHLQFDTKFLQKVLQKKEKTMAI